MRKHNLHTSEWVHIFKVVRVCVCVCDAAVPSALASSALCQTSWWCVVVLIVDDGSAEGCCGSSLHPDGTDSTDTHGKAFAAVNDVQCTQEEEMAWRHNEKIVFGSNEQIYVHPCSEWGSACWLHPTARRAHNPASLDSSSPRSLHHSSAAAGPPVWEWLRGTSPAAPEDDPDPARGLGPEAPGGRKREKHSGGGWILNWFCRDYVNILQRGVCYILKPS